MRLVSYGERGSEKPGLWIGQHIFDLAAAWPDRTPPASVREVLTRDGGLQRAREAAERAESGQSGQGIPWATIRLGAPIPEPSKIIAIGANTWSHLREAARFTHGDPPKQPMLIAKAPSAVIGPEDPIVYPPETQKLDYEIELGVVLGAVARRVRRAEALRYVAGYTVTNDVTARDVQLAEEEGNPFYRQHFWGKSFDTFCPMGPCLVTADEIPDPTRLKLQAFVNGDVRQSGEVSDLIFPVDQLVEAISRNITLFPGDVIVSGSPAGVGYFMDPPGFLKPGDMLASIVPGIGELHNVVVAERTS